MAGLTKGLDLLILIHAVIDAHAQGNPDIIDSARAHHMHGRIRDELSRSEWNV